MCALLVANTVYSLVLKHIIVNMLVTARNELEAPPRDFIAFSLVRENK